MSPIRTNLADEIPTLVCSATAIVDTVLGQARRVLLFGPPGVGKSSLARALGEELHARGKVCRCISADPGSPGFGVPGAAMLGTWHGNGWRMERFVALCTLDAGRYRLPLVSAVQALAAEVSGDILLVDGPGVVRGASGRELLQGLVGAANVDVVLVMSQPGSDPPLYDELRALGRGLYALAADAAARRPGQRARARSRTELWEAYLSDAKLQWFEVGLLNLVGTPPPLSEAAAWTGRQVALLHQRETLAMGEVLRLEAGRLAIRLPALAATADTLLVRDAERSAQDLLETAAPFLAERLEYLPPADVVPLVEESGGPRVAGRIGQFDVALLNGVMGDPLLHVRLRPEGRSLLFDLGDGARLPARLAHQVTDIFISHAHMDHLSGFQWLLRSRLEELPPCRIYGPPGLSRNIEGVINGFLWDRVGDKAPTFIVAELHDEGLRRFRLQVGRPCESLDVVAVHEGVILTEAGFRVRSAVLDHHTPVLAYAIEEEKTLKVRKERLQAKAHAPGPWLTQLKQAVLEGNSDVAISLPDGRELTAGELGDELLFVSPGKKLVYASDLGDTPENRRRLIALANGAHTLFCEATFCEADAERAARSGHLTTRACGEIAAAAAVARLVPFHFSRRYGDVLQQLYEEIGNACGCLVEPGPVLMERQQDH